MKRIFSILFAVVLVVSFSLIPAAPVMAADVTVTVELKDSNGAGLSGGVVEYHDGSWQSFGTTGTDGTVSQTLAAGTYYFRMTYAGATQQKGPQDISTDTVVTFQTTLVTFKLLDSTNAEITGAGAEYCVTSPYKTFGSGTTTATMELLPATYYFQVSYEGASQAKPQNVGSDPNVVFQTTLVTFKLLDSNNAEITGAGAEYHDTSWKTFGSGTTTATMELLPLTYHFRVSYAGASQAKQQNVGTDPVVVFQTTLVTFKLLDSTNAEITGAGAEYHDTSWKTFGSGTTTTTMELLPLTYWFEVSYAGASQAKQQNVGIDPLVVFQTKLVTMKLLDSTGTNELNGGAEYYDNIWKTFGSGTTTTTMELLPSTYYFRVSYAGATEQKGPQYVSIDTVVTFQLRLVTMKLLDSTGTNELNGGAEYYDTSWKTFGSGTTTTTMELLPSTYHFRVSYAGATQQKGPQSVSTDTVVTFQTGKVVDGGFGCDMYYGVEWMAFTDGIQLLPGYFWFRDDGPPVVSKHLQVKAGHTLNLATELYTLWATVDIDPDMVNLRSKGKWITAYIELRTGYDPDQIVLSSVRLNGTIEAVTDPSYDFVTDPNVYITDKDGDGVLERMVKFDADLVKDLLSPGDNVLEITGGLSGSPGVPSFEGSDTVRAK